MSVRQPSDLSASEQRLLARLLVAHGSVKLDYHEDDDVVTARDTLIERGLARSTDYYGWTAITVDGVLALVGGVPA